MTTKFDFAKSIYTRSGQRVFMLHTRFRYDDNGHRMILGLIDTGSRDELVVWDEDGKFISTPNTKFRSLYYGDLVPNVKVLNVKMKRSGRNGG